MYDFDYDIFLENYRQINSYLRENGIEHTVIKPGETISKMTILDKHLSSPNVAHGGCVAGFMDSCLGFCALSAAIINENLVSTIEFKLNYLQPIFKGDKLVGKNRTIRKGKNIIVCVTEIYREEKLLCQGQGTFNVYPLSKRINNI